MADFGDNIDAATFEQILEMDDDEDERDFSKSIVYDFFQQAASTFEKMDTGLYVSHAPPTLEKQPRRTDVLTAPRSAEKDLEQLSALGHFLKGSSATLGLTKVKDSCEKIQHFGARKDETGTRDVDDDDVTLKRLHETVEQAKEEYREAERLLRRFYHDE